MAILSASSESTACLSRNGTVAPAAMEPARKQAARTMRSFGRQSSFGQR
jgi:hypothetical protein